MYEVLDVNPTVNRIRLFVIALSLLSGELYTLTSSGPFFAKKLLLFVCLLNAWLNFPLGVVNKQ